jgi:purine-nucleoside phosphorylase
MTNKQASYTKADYQAAIAAIQQRTDLKPTIGLVLGSGLGALADTLEDRVAIPYEDIPGWPTSTVEGHSGQVVIGKLEGQTVICQQGRAHFYEGYSQQQVTFPIRVMHFMGVKTLILTNAAGGLNKSYNAGDIMVINDHINLVGLVGHNPLIGPNDKSIGPRFIGMVQSYNRNLRKLAHKVAKENNLTLQEGVYCCISGPSFETPAEIRMLRNAGGDSVGMSTAHEVIIARHAGMRVLAFSSVTNLAIDSVDVDEETNHEEVLAAGKTIVPRLTIILKGVLKAL